MRLPILLTLVCASTVCASATWTLADDDPPCALATALGRLRGAPAGGGAFCSYRAIPYAVPPVGDLRWRAPRKAGAWHPHVLDATRYPSTCMQSKQGGWNTIENRGNRSEDCLYLNVVAPGGGGRSAQSPRQRHPVLVYLHAGEFDYGASSDRESDYPFFARDVVLVTPNSRLGAFGYLASEALRARAGPAAGGGGGARASVGNFGIQDQRLALQWVAEHIAAFGGDPDRVVLMGESSGGTSVGAHLTSPASWGLFHRVIMESPGLTQVKRTACSSTHPHAHALHVPSTVSSWSLPA